MGTANLKWWLALFIKTCALSFPRTGPIFHRPLWGIWFSPGGTCSTWAAEVPCNQVRNCITRSLHAAADRNNDHLCAADSGECVICKLMTWLVSALGRLSLPGYVILRRSLISRPGPHARGGKKNNSTALNRENGVILASKHWFGYVVC
jgi:hypothetical protein